MKWLLQRIRHSRHARIGSNTRIWPDAILQSANRGIHIGARCHLHQGVLFLAGPGTLHIGDECSFNPYVVVYGQHGVTIGRQVRVATHVVIGAEGPESDATPGKNRAVIIEDDVWLGCNVVVLQGVRIGRGSVVGAGSVVSRDLPPYSIAVGAPAQPVKSRLPAAS